MSWINLDAIWKIVVFGLLAGGLRTAELRREANPEGAH